MGTRTRLGEGTLLSVADAVEGIDGAEAVYVAIDSPKSVQAANRLAQLVAS
jgi:hypothetical protein